MIYKIIGIEELQGTTFAVCSTEEKAKEAVKILHDNGIHDIDIEEYHLDRVIIADVVIAL